MIPMQDKYWRYTKEELAWACGCLEELGSDR